MTENMTEKEPVTDIEFRHALGILAVKGMVAELKHARDTAKNMCAEELLMQIDNAISKGAEFSQKKYDPGWDSYVDSQLMNLPIASVKKMLANQNDPCDVVKQFIHQSAARSKDDLLSKAAFMPIPKSQTGFEHRPIERITAAKK